MFLALCPVEPPVGKLSSRNRDVPVHYQQEKKQFKQSTIYIEINETKVINDLKTLINESS